MDLFDFADILPGLDLVRRGRIGVDRLCRGVVFPANGDEGSVDILLLVLRPLTRISLSCPSLRDLLRVVTLPPPLGVTFLRVLLIFTVRCSSSHSTFSFSSTSALRELSLVLRRC